MNHINDNNEEMDFEDQESDKDSSLTEIPEEERELRTQAYDNSVINLVNMIRDGEILLDADWQRSYVWDDKTASLLIESILLNIPISSIYVSQDEDRRWIVVDGLQRLYSLRRFFDNEFKLTGLKILHKLNNIRYDKLSPKAKRILNNGVIRIIVFLQGSHPELKYHVFERLNSGAIPHNEQELRNRFYRGRLQRLLDDLRENKIFLSCIGLKTPDKKFYDAELILRYFAFSESYNVRNRELSGYPNQIKKFLNTFMETHKDITEREAGVLKEKFENTIQKVHHVFGDHAFRKIKENGKYDTRINRSLMDIVMVSFEHLRFEDISKHKEKILNLYKNLLLNDDKFKDAVSFWTSDTKKVEYRFAKWFDELSQLTDI
jgi:uncharacterized protein with ParB-like and HNH nuclease domain